MAGSVRVADLADELGRHVRTVRKYVAAHVEIAHQQRLPRASGGCAELWLSPAAIEQVRLHYQNDPPAPRRELPVGRVEFQPSTAPADGPLPDRSDAGWQTAMELVIAERNRLRLRVEELEAALETAQAARDAAERRADAVRVAAWQWMLGARAAVKDKQARKLPPAPPELTEELPA